jgi:hypothetical protein
MRQIWGRPLSEPVLDPEFDHDDVFESEIIGSIRRCGTIDVHPNGWGIHDNIGVYSDNFPYILAETARDRKRRMALRPKESDEVELRRAAAQEREVARAKAKAEAANIVRLKQLEEAQRGAVRQAEIQCLVEMFPHASGSIGFYTAIEFIQFGEDDAKRRGISADEWIWRRSRYLAGHR